MLTKKERCVAIFNCLYFGIVPSRVYEHKCHYAAECTYFEHMQMNLRIAKMLVMNTVPERSHNFHKRKAKYFK